MKRRMVLVMLIAAWSVAGAGAVPPPPPDTIEERVKPCLICHAAEGRSGKNEYYPRLAGKPRGYLFNQMVNFREGQRHHRAMALLLQNLSDAYLAEFADYFAAKQPHHVAAQGKSPAPTLVTKGDSARKIPACVACHGKGLMGVAPNIPGLVGLPHDYISAQFGAWRVGTRRAATPDCMGEIAKQLSEVEVHAVAAWLAAQPLATDARPAPALTEELPTRCGSVLATTSVDAAP